MNPGTDMNPDDPCWIVAAVIGLFRPGERSYQGDSTEGLVRCRLNESRVTKVYSAARKLQSQASVGCGTGAGLAVVGNALQKIPHPYAQVAGAGLIGAGAGILLVCDFVDDQDQSDSTDDSTPASTDPYRCVLTSGKVRSRLPEKNRVLSKSYLEG